MKKHIISVSKHNLTRCSSCNQHHQIDRSLDDQALLALTCDFCGGRLIGSSQPTGIAHFATSRTSKLAMGLLGASLTFSACKEDEAVESTGGSVMMQPAGEPSMEALYGGPPAGIMAPIEAGTEAGAMAGTEAGTEMAGVEMMEAGENIAIADYGNFPAGEMAGEMAGETAGEMAGEMAGETAGVEMTPAGDDMAQPEYGAFPAGEEE